MNHQLSVKLHELLGVLEAHREIACCGVQSAKDALGLDVPEWARGYFEGLQTAFGREAIHCNHAINLLQQILEVHDDD